MREYYIRTATYGTDRPDIIDDEAMYQAERGMNHLNPSEYMFHCEADNLHDAKEQYWDEVSRLHNDHIGERSHP
jgi:hypothetical protein